MRTLVALYKPFDLSLQNLIKYKYLLYISFFVLFGFDCALLPKEKKGNERAGREKGKNGPDVLTSLFAFSLRLSSQLMLYLFLDVCEFFFFLLLFFFFCVCVCVCVVFLSFVTFYLYLICFFVKINKSIFKKKAGHVSPRIWEITSKRFGGGAGKCGICLYRA